MQIFTSERMKRLGEVMLQVDLQCKGSSVNLQTEGLKTPPESHVLLRQNTPHHASLPWNIYHCCYVMHGLLVTSKARRIQDIILRVRSAQSESEPSLVLEGLCFRFLFLFFLSFFFLSFLFFLFLLRWWSEEEEEEEEELSESEEVVS